MCKTEERQKKKEKENEQDPPFTLEPKMHKYADDGVNVSTDVWPVELITLMHSGDQMCEGAGTGGAEEKHLP